jgi:type IV secretory pathway TrbD component
MATGLIVGESLFGVVFAGIVAASGSDAPLAIVGDGFADWAVVLGVVLFVVTVAALYRAARRSAGDRVAVDQAG